MMVRAAIIMSVVLLGLANVMAQTQRSLLQSDGVIHNTGRIVIRGDAYLAQDSIGSLVQYVRNNPADSQRVEHMTYVDLHFEGRSLKSMRTPNQSVIATNVFSSADAQTVFDLDQLARIEARGTVTHNGIINPGLRYGTFELNGLAPQNVSGSGSFVVLEQNNPTQSTITGSTTPRITERLDLRQGLLDNSAASNVLMMDDAWIWRNDNASIGAVPQTQARMHLRYYGTAPTTSGPEFLQDPTTLRKLYQDNIGGLTMTWDATVNDSMILRGHILTEPDSLTQHALTYTPGFDPIYVGTWPEVDGTMIRTNVVVGQAILMNAEHTFMRFNDTASRGNVRAVRLRTKRSTVPLPIPEGIDKVRRFYQLTMLDANMQAVPDSTWATEFGYAWRRQPAPDIETNAVIEIIPLLQADEDSLILLRFDGGSYVREGNSVLPTRLATGTGLWRHSTALTVSTNGDFAIGLASTAPTFVLRVRVLLEGAMRGRGDNIASTMGTDLRQRDLVPSTPPQIYPYTLDPLSGAILVPIMPDTIVDWMIVELRSEATGGRTYYQTVLLSQNGYLVDPLTTMPVAIANVQAGEYHVVLRHRNHLAIMTEQKHRVSPGQRDKIFDFTLGTDIFGGASAMKLLGTENGRRLFGMVAGQTSGDDDVLRIDQNLVWDNRDLEGYSIFDTDMDGIISTKDWNLSWNNRERSSAVP